ncbi:MAG TPA: DEAD/DEAH box helicase family protein [Anaerolineae bacterium]|nr:DEAD/DEAH box helicase family protein [Anaerolineae bacterium]
MQLRAWQEEALQAYHHALTHGITNLLWEATPGAGKTAVALQLCAHQRRILGRHPIIIVVPTTHLKTQWARAALQAGLHLDSGFSSQHGLAPDYDGLVVTFQQVANRPKLYRRLSQNAVVVLDEIHHAGDGLSWGEAMRLAFEPAQFVLALSGTAFRSDNNAIPFVTYQDDESAPDFVYDYGRAIEDGVCRSVAFFTYGGEVAWLEDEELIEANFSSELARSTAARRLRAALDPQSGWIQQVLLDAHSMLVETRHEHPDAGGLLVAADQDHARQLARLLQELTDLKPTVVLSDDSKASGKIKRFAAGRSEWLVACNMVSEGVDIPRLRVGVYATTIVTKLYFRQFLGRIVRVTEQPAGVQVAYCYLPADVRLRAQAEQIERIQRHLISPQLPPDEETRERPDIERAGPPTWQPLASRNSGLEAVIINGGQLALWHDPALLPTPKHVKEEVQRKVSERVAPATRSETKAALSQRIQNLVSSYHHVSGLPHRQIHARLNRTQNVHSQTVCTEEQLKARIGLLERMLQNYAGS